MGLDVRPMLPSEAYFVVDYFHNASSDYLWAMGADSKLLPKKEEWISFIQSQTNLPYESKKYFYVIWLENDLPVGHSNINFIQYGKDAFMHLHLWSPEKRKKGMGVKFVRKSVPYYFKLLKIKTLNCEVNAFNVAPNMALPLAGFTFIKQRETIPGPINYKQVVNRYELTLEEFSKWT